MLENFTLETFTGRIGQTVEVSLPEGGVVLLVVDSVQPSPYQGKPSDGEPQKRRPFSLFLTGALRPYLLQGTYSFAFPELDPIGIFIVPVGPKDGRMLYEAVFT